jgi:putative aldouronate transport system substrate-binding protein
MKNTKTKWIAVTAIILISIIALTAAGGRDQGKGGESASPREVHMVAVSMGPVQRGLKEVEDAVNAITIPALNIKIKYTQSEVGAYSNQINLMMASGEKMDLLGTTPSGSASFNSLVAQNQLADITGLLDTHGQGIVKAINDVTPGLLEGTTVDKKIRGVTVLMNKVTSHYWCIRNDLLKKHNIDVSGVKSLSQIEAILEKMKQAEPNMSPLVPSGSAGMVLTQPGIFYNDSFSDPIRYDFLGDSGNRVGISFMTDINKVVNHYKSDPWKKSLDLMRKWYQKGYIYRDSSVNTQMAEELVKSGKGFSWFSESELGAAAAKSSQSGYEIITVKMADMPITSGVIRRLTWTIPSTSKEGEAAMRFLNMMYTDERIVNLLAWGIEGRDYVVKADGTVGYPAGVTASTVPYHSADFLFGSQYLTKVWEGSSPTLRQEALALNRSAPRSELLGFAFNNTAVSNEISAITNIIQKYRAGLQSGVSDPAVENPNLVRDLDAAGAEKVITEIQRQLNQWLASK